MQFVHPLLFLLLLVAFCIFAIPAAAEIVGFYLWRRRMRRGLEAAYAPRAVFSQSDE